MVYPFGLGRRCIYTTVRHSVRTYVFSELCSIFQYVIKRWLRAHSEAKVITVVYEYTYQDHEYIIRTMNTKHEPCGVAFLLQAALSCPKSKTFIVSG